MTVFLAILGALVGGVLGAFLGFFAITAFAALTGVSDPNGGVEMGAALVGGPVGTVVGAILGCLLVLRLRRGKTGDGGKQGWIALGVVGATLAGLWVWLFHEPKIPHFSNPRPVLTVEISMPRDELKRPQFADFATRLRSHHNSTYPNGPMAEREENGYAILTSEHSLINRIAERSIELYLDGDELLIFHLPLGASPEYSDEFSDWRRVDFVKEHFHGEDLDPEGKRDIFIRTKVQPGSS